MKRINQMILVQILFFVLMGIFLNAYVKKNNGVDEKYHIAMNHVVAQIKEGVPPEQVYKEDSKIKKVFLVDFMKQPMLIENSENISYWMIYDERGNLKQVVGIEYDHSIQKKNSIYLLNFVLLISMFLVIGWTVFLKYKIILPFQTMIEIPVKLANGKYVGNIHEEKGRYFGKFLWGLSMLSERLERERYRAIELKKEHHTLMTSISHGIKTPVTNINLYASSIQEGIVQEDQVKEYAKKIIENGDKINTLVKELLHTSSEDKLEATITLRRFYLQEVIVELSQNHEETMKLLSIPFQVECERNPMLYSDKDVILLCIGNLIDNAIKYGDGRFIRVKVELDEDMILIYVRNSGNPLPKHELPYIYTSYWRGSNSKEKPGNGLGLMICKNSLRKLGGDIQAECMEDGMRFLVAIPIDTRNYIFTTT